MFLICAYLSPLPPSSFRSGSHRSYLLATWYISCSTLYSSSSVRILRLRSYIRCLCLLRSRPPPVPLSSLCYGLRAVGLVPADRRTLLTSHLGLCPYSLKFVPDSGLSPSGSPRLNLVTPRTSRSSLRLRDHPLGARPVLSASTSDFTPPCLFRSDSGPRTT